jgi:2-oxoglutarate ferredoxin oxidoreductase subunit beta
MMALSFETSFVARGFSGDMAQLKDIIRQAMDHKGFSFVHVLSPCIQYNNQITFETIKEHVQHVPEDHDVTDRISGMKLVFEPGTYYTGVIYKHERPTLEEKLDEVKLKSNKKDSEEEQIQEFIKQFM